MQQIGHIHCYHGYDISPSADTVLVTHLCNYLFYSSPISPIKIDTKLYLYSSNENEPNECYCAELECSKYSRRASKYSVIRSIVLYSLQYNMVNMSFKFLKWKVAIGTTKCEWLLYKIAQQRYFSFQMTFYVSIFWWIP